jgi:hypothetical protein
MLRPPGFPLHCRQVPAARCYQYAVVDDRVFLVDPETRLITAELND